MPVKMGELEGASQVVLLSSFARFSRACLETALGLRVGENVNAKPDSILIKAC